MSETKENIAMLDPDVRFLLANERTLLAWIRTSLALIAGGLALTQFGLPSMSHTMFGSTAILLGAAMSVLGYARFRAADRAIRASKLPDMGRGPVILLDQALACYRYNSEPINCLFSKLRLYF